MSQLRTRIAESLGWKHHATKGISGITAYCWESPAGAFDKSPPNWQEDPAAALGLYEALSKDGFGVDLYLNDEKQQWECTAANNDGDYHEAEAKGTGPHAFCSAICGAYAKAKNLTLTEEKP